jgi:hypothetical protein
MKKYSLFTLTLLVSSLVVKAQVPETYDKNKIYPASSLVINDSKTMIALRDVPHGTSIDSKDFWDSIENLAPTFMPPGRDQNPPPFVMDIDEPPIIEYWPTAPQDEFEDQPDDPDSEKNPSVEAPNTDPGTPPHPDYLDTIAELRKLLEEKDQLITECEEKITDQSYKMQKLTEDNSRLNEEINELNSKVEEMDSQLAEVKKDNTSLQSQAENLRAENQNIRDELNTANENMQEAIRVAETPFINGWVYDPIRGWMFTDAEHFPLVYTNKDQSWNYYELGSSEPRFFFSFAKQEWVAWDE